MVERRKRGEREEGNHFGRTDFAYFTLLLTVSIANPRIMDG